MDIKKPFSTYNGGKEGNGTFQNIINNVPKCTVFVEPFAGNCAIARHIARPAVTVISDIDSSIYGELLKLQKHGIIVRNECYKAVIAEYDCNNQGAFFYLDPPYHFSTRKSQQRLYAYEFSDSDHAAFLSLAVKVESNCMISHYPCELYDNALKSWRTFDFESSTRSGMRTERLYMNYAAPKVLQDYRYLGDNFIKRQQIKRKTERWLNRLEALPPLERDALVSSVIAKYGYASDEKTPLSNSHF